MKWFILSLLFSINLFAQTEIDPTIERDLELIKKLSSRIGGAGNGGGEMALKITRSLNLRAQQMGIKDLRAFASKYKLLVGAYRFCGIEVKECDLAAIYYETYATVLVNGKKWQSLNEIEQRTILDEMVIKIYND